MSLHSPLETLCELAQQAVEQATGQLGEVRQAFLVAEQQLNLLIGYQDEYRQRLSHQTSDGIGAASWHNYQQFIHTLDQAIEQHRRQLLQWNSKLDQALRHWQEKQQRLNAFTTLQARAMAEWQLQESRLDQKRMDEFAQRASYGKETQ